MNWLEPIVGGFSQGGRADTRTLIDPGISGWEVPAMFEHDGALIVRLFNASGDATPQELGIGFEARKIELVELDGRVIQKLEAKPDEDGKRTVLLSIPRFGIRTLRFSGVLANGK
jgi:alpha-mannosidase